MVCRIFNSKPSRMDGLSTNSDSESTQDLTALIASINKGFFLDSFRDLLAELNKSTSPVTCIVADGFMSFSINAANELGIPVVSFFPIAACGFIGFKHYRALFEKGLMRHVYQMATLTYLDTVIDWIPGLRHIRLRDLPTFLRTTDPKDICFNSAMLEVERAHKASAVACTYFILSMHWSKKFGWGLANSKFPFLWVIRPDWVVGESAILPPEFVAETKEKSVIAIWRPQEDVLNHPSVGGFLTHSGWNSTIESVSAGVPMLCRPFFAEQQTNTWYACNVLGIGKEIDNDVKRDGVEKLVRELMEGEKSEEMKKKANVWKKLAEQATNSQGSRRMLPKCF